MNLVRNPNPQSAVGKILPLTSLRFLAAFMVFLVHVGANVPWMNMSTFIGRLASLGYVGVPFFFELSGFVLALAYLKAENPIDLRQFSVARFARIYPALFVCLLVALPIYVHAELRIYHHSAWDIVKILVLAFTAQEAWRPSLALLDTPSWTITNEIVFYMLFPFVAPRLWKMRLGPLCLTCLSLFVAENLLVVLCSRSKVPPLVIDRWPWMHLGEFLIGICVAKIAVLIGQDADKAKRLRHYAPAISLASLLLFLSIPLLRLPVSASLLQHILLTPVFSAIILAFASGNTLIERLFSPAWFVLLGEASYAFYLLHVTLIDASYRQLRSHSLIVLPLVLGIAVGLSIFSFLKVETPARHWLMRAASRGRESRQDLALR